MRITYPIETIEEIEKALKESGMAFLGHDGSRSFFLFPRDRKTTRSSAFVRVYEVYLDPRAKEAIRSKKWDASLELTLMHQIIVKLYFDYRQNNGVISIANPDVNTLLKAHSFMKPYLGANHATEGNTVIHQHTDPVGGTAVDYGL